MKNLIQFKHKFVKLTNNEQNNRDLAMTVTSELMQFGVLLDDKAIENISKATKEDIILFHNEIIEYLKEITGANRNYQPFWKNFPIDVMSKTEGELWFHQIIHYLSNGTYEPNELTQTKPTAFEQPEYMVITVGDEDKFLNIFNSLISVNNSLTPFDFDTINWFISNVKELRFPNTIPFKENLCAVISSLILSDRIGEFTAKLTVTDVLRVSVFLSDGDISLPKVPKKHIKLNAWSNEKSLNPYRESFKFSKFNRKYRKIILSLLENTNCDASEGVLKDVRWVRLGEILHPGEFKNKYPKSFNFFSKIRSGKTKSWNSEVESAFKESFVTGLVKLSDRPGEYMRRLDALIRKNPNNLNDILEVLTKISNKISNKVLFEAYVHFKNRNKLSTNRSIMIKGARKRVTLPELTPLSDETVNRVITTIINSLSNNFSKLERLSSVYIDEELRKIPLPKNMRSLNPSLKPIVRGQRTPIGNKETKVLRAFVHWFDVNGNEDLDLTATFVGMGRLTHIGWNGTHSSDVGCYSGDVRHRKGACAEYIDIDVKKSLGEGYKYVVLDVRNYTGRGLDSVKDCVFGYMEREYPESNTTFVPKTLSNTVQLKSSSTNTIPVIIDLETMEYIYLDIDSSGLPVASADFDKLLTTIKQYSELPDFSVYDLLSLHVNSRGGKVVKKEDSDIVFEYSDFSQSYIKTLEFMGI
jgi:hypothetical protein